jgi:release factor glutamine methyltransferase
VQGSEGERPALAHQVRCLARFLAKAGADSPGLSAEILTAKALGITRQALLRELILAPDRAVSEAAIEILRDLAGRRAAGEPAAYLTGHKEFFGHDFLVTPAVLIPRPETELLVETALAGASRREAGVFADFGTGSGCIAVSLALEMPGWRCLALDRSSQALKVAKKNAEALKTGEILFFQADFCRPPLGTRSLDLLVGNPPYVSGAEYRNLDREVRNFEPKAALVPAGGASSGLEAVAAIAEQAGILLRPGGRLLLEIGHAQERAALALLHPRHWAEAQVLPDLAGLPRLLAAKRR